MRFDVILLRHSLIYLSVEEAVPHSVEEESDQSVAEVEDRDGPEEGVPEPEDQVDLLVDDVLS